MNPILFLTAAADAGGEARFTQNLPDLQYLRGASVYAQGASVTGTIQFSNAVHSRICY